MLNITFPGTNFRQEYQYIAECVFGHFLRAPWRDAGCTEGCWTVSYGASTLRFPNLLFPEQNPDSWLTPAMPRPKAVYIADEPQLSPFPYALPEARTLQEADIFGSIFFFLAALEHEWRPPLDEFGNMDATRTFLGKNGLLARPVVDECLDALLALLRRHEMPCEHGAFSYALQYSCDIDTPTLWFACSPVQRMRYLLAAALKHRSLRRCRDIFASTGDIRRDLYYTFPFIFATLEDLGIAGQFNVMTGATHRTFDTAYSLSDAPIAALLRQITDLGHEIGFHPSFATMSSEELFRKEYERLCAHLGHPVTCGRQHYLRFAGCTTWRMWDNAHILYDSTCGFFPQTGFRMGTSRPYRVFDVQRRRALRLTEYPLVIMDCSLYSEAATDEDIYEHALRLNQEVRKHSGTMTFLWHNHFFEDDGKRHMFQRLLKAFA
ncbi:MAG: hypothetical protein E7022_09995 [Desulfovibrio desulfuricans]|nr:hypothetical protein [Desulfovibrio desulfuricans]